MKLLDKLKNRTATVGIIGLGYVGLPLAVAVGEAGFQTIGFDINSRKVSAANAGRSYLSDLASERLSLLIKSGNFRATTGIHHLADVDVICICVPTPLSKTRTPDISYITSVTKSIVKYLGSENLVILESTSYPGTTEEVMLPMLEADNIKVGRDFFLAFSPERIDPGNRQYRTENTPKVVGGVTDDCTSTACVFYQQFIDSVVSVSSSTTAESVKLLENTFRAVNIALVNEFSQMCDKMGIDVWEVIEAAATKPFGYMPFYPGPGLGGHCIPVDPHYLAWKSRLHGHSPRFIDLATEINSAMPGHIVGKVAEYLNQHRLSINGSSVYIIGVSYKPNVNDIRESPALEVMSQLIKRGANLTYHDPLVSKLEVSDEIYHSQELSETKLDQVDCVLILTNHSVLDYDLLAKYESKLIDTRNSFTQQND